MSFRRQAGGGVMAGWQPHVLQLPYVLQQLRTKEVPRQSTLDQAVGEPPFFPLSYILVEALLANRVPRITERKRLRLEIPIDQSLKPNQPLRLLTVN